MRRAILLVLCLLLLSACAPRVVTLEPVHVRVDLKAGAKEPAVQKVGVIDTNLPPGELFELGYKAYNENQLELALAYFRAIVDQHPKSGDYSSAAYNAAVILHRWNRFEDALVMYEKVVEAKADAKDMLDARFRMLACYYELGRWAETLTLCDTVQRLYGRSLSADDQVELAARRGVARFSLGETDAAEPLLKDAFHDYKIGLRRGDIVSEYAGAMAAYFLGMIERGRFESAQVAMGQDQEMARSMEVKAQKLLDAQEWFLQSIEQDNAVWATAAGHQIGRLYYDFFSSIQNVPLPADITGKPDEELMYRCMLSDKVRVLLRKAMKIYDRTVQMGERLRVKNRWTEQTKQDLAEVEKLYIEDLKRCENVLPQQMGMLLPCDL